MAKKKKASPTVKGQTSLDTFFAVGSAAATTTATATTAAAASSKTNGNSSPKSSPEKSSSSNGTPETKKKTSSKRPVVEDTAMIGTPVQQLWTQQGEFVIGEITHYDAEFGTYTVQFGSKEETWNSEQVKCGQLLYTYFQTKRLTTTATTRVAKEFEDGEIYQGTVVEVFLEDKDNDEKGDVVLFGIEYEDGDTEDLNVEEFQEAQALYQQQQQEEEEEVQDDKEMEEEEEEEEVTSSGRKKRSRRSIKPSYREDSEEEEEEEFDDGSSMEVDDDDEEVPALRPRSRSRAPPKKKPRASSKAAATKKRKQDDDEDDDFSMDEAQDGDSEEEEDEELIAEDDGDDDSAAQEEEEEEEEDEEEEEEEDDDNSKKTKAKSKAKKPAAKKTATSKKKSTGPYSGNDGSSSLGDDRWDAEFKKKIIKDRKAFKPNNNPQKWPKDGAYVDPVGVDPTQGIVEGIINAQVAKVGGLLQMVQQQQQQATTANNNNHSDNNEAMGELSYPIQLQTACSGTDAPSIALGLIKESLDKMLGSNNNNGNGNGHLFEYSHEMSCEIEPFKQAYIGRNFPGVPLFPDITKLTASEEVVDVYGRPQTIPEGTLFIAGTSCKDFSMLKSQYRKDIEDKGTSGETFTAAVEFLDQKQPNVAIFENVDGAPWGKMQEYIQGRVFLGNRNTTKAIKDAKKKADADNELKFSVTKDGRYVAEAVPRQVGIRAGSIVRGFVRGGHSAKDVKPLVSAEPKKMAGKTITLGQLAKEHKINLKKDTLVMEKKAAYCTHLIKLDTKDYGLPQTRNRKYLFIWRSDDPDDDLGKYFEEIMKHLETPLLHSMDAFLLPDTHDRIRCFREALRSGPGLMVKRERAKEPDFFDWPLSRVKDSTLHLVFRENNGLAELSRWLTGWATRGRKLLAPSLWPELFDCWNMRRLDMIDCFAGAAIRDAISRDPLHHFFTWDLSQNVTRAPFRAATCGVSSCVTPGGELLLPHKGRTVMGYEKLLLQGIPFSRLKLGTETEVQLSDMAGNAMSVPVVCATMLAAMCAPQLRRQRRSQGKCLLKHFALSQKYDKANGSVLAERGDLYKVARDADAKDFIHVFRDISRDLAQDAFRSSVLCTCESSGTTTSDPKILECQSCGLCICHVCSGRCSLSSHSLETIEFSKKDGRPDPHVFERKLRCAVPSILRLGHGWEKTLSSGQGLESYSFQLQAVHRKKGHWQLVYGAWEDHGSARQVADIRVEIGRTGTLDTEVGVAAYIRCFAPAIRSDKPVRGTLKDSARVIFKVNGTIETIPRWEVPDKTTTAKLVIEGSGEVESQRVLVGLDDTANKGLKGKKIAKSFLPPLQSRNPLTHYHPKWKTWPETLVVSGDSSCRVNGTYRKQSCTHSVVLSALWSREPSDDDQPPMHIFFRPDVLRTKLDVAVFSPTPSYGDNLEICELHDWIPENAFKESTHTTKATFLEWKNVPANMRVEVPKPSMSMVALSGSFDGRLHTTPQQDSTGAVLCEMAGLSKELIGSLLEHSESNGEGEDATIDLTGKSGTRNAKRLSIIAAPSLLKYAAEDKLPLTLSRWYRLPATIRFGHCPINVPPRPVEKWQEKPGRDGIMERIYDAEESNEYYRRLFNRPEAFQVNVDKSEGKLVVRMNPHVAAHRAAAHLGGEDTGAVNVDYCLSELSSMGEPPTREFQVPNSDAYMEAEVDGLALPLYTRQAKALTRMLAIESGSVKFAEEERSETVLPGIGWCMIARASKYSPLRGGVLGDAIGSGKTVVTIALILAGAKKARANRNMDEGRSSATLIVVPPGLVRQWDDERKKFTKDKLSCITIDCVATLKRYSVKDLCNADLVICPASIIEEGNSKNHRPYTERLSTMAKAGKIPPAPQGYSQREAPTIEGTWVRNMASGPGIYVGNKGTQVARDTQAYYGHCYSEAIAKLREKRFGPSEKGVPIEYFTWERIVIDECHETLVTGKSQETKDADFKEKARRGAREFLGVSQTDITKRPLLAASGVWGLTGTPLLETEARVTELANLMGGTYLTGASHHWRKEERESGRDLFLNQQEGTRSREYRCAVQQACHAYVREACQRNRGEQLQVQLTRKRCEVNMSSEDGGKFLKSIKRISENELDSFGISPPELGDKAGQVLSLTASSKARHAALLETIDSIQKDEPETKIVVFANTSYGGYDSCLSALTASGKKFCHVSDEENSVEQQNEIISWFRFPDVTVEEKKRARILLLSFEQAAGHNLQEACHNVIMYDPYYSGTDSVADASVEEQALGRVMRQGQKFDVTVTRLVLKGPDGEPCLDDWIIRRNLDDDVLAAATSNFN